MPSENMDPVDSFVTTMEVMDVEEYTKSNRYHSSFCKDFTSGLVNETEFKAQIKFQSNLLNLCSQKIDQLTTENSTEKINSDILDILSLRIHKMYMLWFEILGTDAIMVTDYIKFGSEYKLIFTEFKKALDQLMEYFHMDPDIYVTVARCVFNDFNDIKSARKYLENGMKHHNQYKKLFEEDFCLEIEILKNTKGASFPTVLKKYQKIIAHFKDDMNLHFILVEHALNIFWVRELPFIIVKDMLNIYKESEFMWQNMAKIQLRGYIYSFKSEYIYQCTDDLNCISNCVNTYERGLKEDWLPANRQNLWNFYLDEIIEISESDRTKNIHVKDFLDEVILRVFDEAHSNNMFSKPKHYIFWSQHAPPYKELLILKESVTIMRDNPDLWAELLGYYLNKDYFQRGWSIFMKSVDALKEKSLPLWRMMNLYVLNTNDETIRKFYEEASFSEYKHISMEYRTLYLQWTFMRFDIRSARNLFDDLKELQPVCKELYLKMLNFECLSYLGHRPSLIIIRELFSETCSLFGHDDIKLWTKCLHFEYTHGRKKLLNTISSAALNILEPQYRSTMMKITEDLMSNSFSGEIVEIND